MAGKGEKPSSPCFTQHFLTHLLLATSNFFELTFVFAFLRCKIFLLLSEACLGGAHCFKKKKRTKKKRKKEKKPHKQVYNKQFYLQLVLLAHQGHLNHVCG